MRESSLLKHYLTKVGLEKIENINLTNREYSRKKPTWMYKDQIPFEIHGIKIG